MRPINDFIEFTGDQINQSIPERFNRQARIYPSRLAVKTDSLSLTYKELNDAANAIAQAVLASGTADDMPIVLLLGKGSLLIAAMLGVLKAGKFYVPLDASYPVSRNEHILKDSQASLIIADKTNLSSAERLSGGKIKLLVVDQLDFHSAAEDPNLPISPDRIAYILYTSGSTGKPKGVVQNHRNVLHNVMKSVNGLHICADDRITLLPSPSVGASVSDIFGALLNGASLFPFDVAEQGLARLAAWLSEEEITIYHSVPSVFSSMASVLTEDNLFPRLRLIKLSGELVRSKDVDLYKKRFSNDCILHVSLGATEMNVIRQFFLNKETVLDGGIAPVGYAVGDTEILLFDDAGEEVGPESVGEIAVRSRYLAPCYWRQPELSSKTFRPDSRSENEKIYFTGDLGYLLPDGCLVCLGRKDSQVKIRGYRVETAEIETALLNLKGVKEAVVTAQEDEHGEKQLAAHIVLENESNIKTHELRSALRESLPDFMIPAAIIFLDELPRTPAGKADRSRLKIQNRLRPSDEPFAAPQNPLQAKMQRIWQEVMGLSQIGIKDDFFNLGGNSLKGLLLLSKIDETFKKRFPLAALLQASTIEKLVELLQQGSFSSILIPVHRQGSRPPLFCVPGAVGDAFYFRNLALFLGDDHPVYGLQMPWTTDSEAEYDSLEDLSREYIKQMRAVQPAGPYYIAGFSGGGLIAVDIAQQLIAEGEKIPSVMLVDSYGPQYPKRLPVVQRAAAHWKTINELNFSEKKVYLKEQLRPIAVPLKISLLLKLNKRYPNSQKIKNLVKNSHSFIQYSILKQTYNMKSYPSRVDLFRAIERPNIYYSDPTLGWSNFIKDLKIYDMPGNHADLPRKNMRILAENFAAVLDELQKDHKS